VNAYSKADTQVHSPHVIPDVSEIHELQLPRNTKHGYRDPTFRLNQDNQDTIRQFA
jgi:hypothetical protein